MQHKDAQNIAILLCNSVFDPGEELLDYSGEQKLPGSEHEGSNINFILKICAGKWLDLSTQFESWLSGL